MAQDFATMFFKALKLWRRDDDEEEESGESQRGPGQAIELKTT